VPDHLRTEAISRVAVLGFAGFFLAPALMGFVSEIYGLRIAFLGVAGLALAAIPLTLLLRRI
jgi:predicted MFS family arabinose efflux permease